MNLDWDKYKGICINTDTGAIYEYITSDLRQVRYEVGSNIYFKIQAKWKLRTWWYPPKKESFINEKGFLDYRNKIGVDYNKPGFLSAWKEVYNGLYEKYEWRDLPEVRSDEL